MSAPSTPCWPRRTNGTYNPFSHVWCSPASRPSCFCRTTRGTGRTWVESTAYGGYSRNRNDGTCGGGMSDSGGQVGGSTRLRQVTRSAGVLLAPNPGPMTLDGTNTWLLRLPGSDRCAVVDPGPSDEEHLAAVAMAGSPVEAILLTHGHLD